MTGGWGGQVKKKEVKMALATVWLKPHSFLCAHKKGTGLSCNVEAAILRGVFSADVSGWHVCVCTYVCEWERVLDVGKRPQMIHFILPFLIKLEFGVIQSNSLAGNLGQTKEKRKRKKPPQNASLICGICYHRMWWWWSLVWRPLKGNKTNPQRQTTW